jgi:hypothetical protein
MTLGARIAVTAALIAWAATGTGRTAAAGVPGAIDPGGAPPERESPAGAGTDPGPGPEPAAPATGPRQAGGDAEAAPATPNATPTRTPTAAAEAEAHWRRHRIAIGPRFSYRLGDAGRAVTPAPGYGVVGTFEVGYARPAPRLELALGLDFSSDLFTKGEGVHQKDGTLQSTSRVISESNFVLVHTAAASFGRARPFVTLGAGIGFGHFESFAPELGGGASSSGAASSNDTHLLGRAAVGVDVSFGDTWSGSLRADYTAVRRASPIATPAGPAPVFGDLLDVDVAFVYRF